LRIAFLLADGLDTHVDDEQLRELRAWAGRLAADERTELKAAGKAIVMLADEVEALRARQAHDGESVEAEPEPVAIPAGASADEVGSTLRERLRSFTRARQ
jgi:hypothetical protein